MKGTLAENEFRLFRREQTVIESLDLHVNASPLDVCGERFVLCALTDISHETRRRSMERIFFHDVLNLAGGISGLVEVLSSSQTTEGMMHEFGVLQTATQALVDEILAQRELLAAESNDLQSKFTVVGTKPMLAQLCSLYVNTPAAHGQEIALFDDCADCVIETDVRLAQRVLGNMLKNALEAGRSGDTVRLGCNEEGNFVRFFVRNSSVMDQSAQQSIFRRSFSTKGSSRGLGTYSMLLLAERYLGGSVGFNSTEADGTTFFLHLPKAGQTA
jgi:signal transduction histidine kinase